MLTVGGRPVAYDAPTSALLDVDPVLAAVLPRYGPLAGQDLADALPHHQPAAIAAAVVEIEQARRDEGLFLPEADLPPCDRGDPTHAPPRHVVLEITERCNLRCRYCLHGAARDDVRPHGTRDMPVTTALAALRDVMERCAPADEPSFSFYGGEPLLALPVIRAVLAEARAHPEWPRAFFALDTNGVALTDEVADLIVAEGLGVQFSLDGPARLHDRHRCDADGHGTHALVEAAVRRLLAREAGIARRLSFQAMLAPPYDLPAVIDYFAAFPPYRDAGIARRPQVRLGIAALAGTTLEPLADRAELRAQLAAARARYRAACLAGKHDDITPILTALFDPAMLRIHQRPRGPRRSRLDAGCCRPGEQRLHVDVAGAFRPCERVRRQQLIGHVGAGVDRDAAAALERDFRAATQDRCASCWAVRLCTACVAALPGEGGLSPATCARLQAQCADDLVLYQELLDGGPDAYAWLLAFSGG